MARPVTMRTPGGSTPTILNGAALIVMTRSSTPGSPPNRRGYASALAFAGLVVAGLLPVWRITRAATWNAIRPGSAQGGKPETSRSRLVLVGAQVALTVVLAFGCSQLVRSAIQLGRVDLGYDPNVLALGVPFDFRAYLPAVITPQSIGAARAQLYQRIRDRVKQVSGVTAVGVASHVPFVQGRDVTDAEERQAQPVVIVDESLVREAFPGETNVIGKTLKLGWGLQNSRIKGVVKHQRAIDISREIRPQVFATLGSLFQNPGFVVVRGNGDLPELTAAIVRAISEERPGGAVTTIAMLSDNVAAATSTLTAVTALVTSLAISAGVLSAIGLYLVLSFIVYQQRRATAIRTALGASPGQVMWQHGRTSALVMLIAIPIGVGLALAIAPYLAELLFRVGRRDGSSVAIAVVAAALTAADRHGPADRPRREREHRRGSAWGLGSTNRSRAGSTSFRPPRSRDR
jgi:hypothetical protein